MTENARRRGRVDGGDDGAPSRVGGVVLAAGESRRFDGGNKLLASVDGTPMVRQSAATLLDARLDGVVAIVGHEAEAVRGALDGLGVSTRRNGAYAAGQSASVREGVGAARQRGWDAAVFALGDMPFVSPATVDALVEVHAAGGGSIVAPTYESERGNPVLFDAACFDALAEVSGDSGGRRLVAERPDSAFVPVDDPGVRRDVDRRADVARYTD